nr:hypothetical protein CFP56_41324 [Quercus suber]
MSPILNRLLREAKDSSSPDRYPGKPRRFRKRHSRRRLWSLNNSPPVLFSLDSPDTIFPPTTPFGERKQLHGQPQRRALLSNKNTNTRFADAGLTRSTEGGVSSMGVLARLPGEIRNQIYQDLLVSPETTLITCNELVCGRGSCEHTQLSTVVPIAATCQHICSEVMPIFCSRNTFHFDEAMVRNRCVANYLECLGMNAPLIAKIILQIKLGEPRNFFNMTIAWPSGRPVISDDCTLPEKYVDVSQLDSLVMRLNMQKGCLLDKVLYIVSSDELSDLAWRCGRLELPGH